MKRIFFILIFFVNFLFAADMQDVLIDLGENRLKIEKELEIKTEKFLQNYFNLKNVLVSIKIIPYLGIKEIEEEKKRNALPGVPMAEEIMGKKEKSSAVRYFIKMMEVTVFLPDDFPGEKLTISRKLITDLLNMDFARGDKLEVKTVLVLPEKKIDIFSLGTYWQFTFPRKFTISNRFRIRKSQRYLQKLYNKSH